jgi:hypothetical protein
LVIKSYEREEETRGVRNQGRSSIEHAEGWWVMKEFLILVYPVDSG